MINNLRRWSIGAATANTVTVVAILAGALLVSVTPSRIEAETVDCTEITDVGDRMKCKHGGLLDEQKRVIDNLEINFGGVVSTDNFERLKKAHTRAKNANGRMDGKKYKSLGKKHKDNQNQNQNGNETDDTDLEFMADLEDNYDDVTKNTKAANDLMENNGEQLASLARPLLAANAPSAMAGPMLLTTYEPADACKTSINWLTYGRVLTMTIMKQVAVGLKGIADIAGKGCDQDAAGFNASVACIVFEGAAAVAALVVETTGGIFELVQWGVDSSNQQCVSSLSADLQETKATLGAVATTSSNSNNQLGGIVADVQNIKTTVNNLTGSVNSLSNSVNTVQQQVNNLSGSMNDRFNEVNAILNTPQGRRDMFPAK
jgi:hypothetical protein